jgi:hypothetical protein
MIFKIIYLFYYLIEQTNADKNHLSTVNNEQNNKPEQEKTLTLKEKLQIFENPIL